MPGTPRLPTRTLLTRWTVALLAFGLLWRITRYFLVFPMWGDEAFVSVSFFGRGFADMVHPLEHYQIVPAGFMWLVLATTKLLGTGELALRLVPAVAGVASLGLFWHLARQLVDRRSAFLAFAFLVASYFPVRYSTEVKPYSTDLFFALWMLWAAWRIWERPSLSRWLMFTAAGAISIWMSYPAVFVASGSGLVLGLRALGLVDLPDERRESESTAPTHASRTSRVSQSVPWLASGLVLAFSLVAMYLIVAKGQEQSAPLLYENENWTRTFPPLSEPWHLPVWFFQTHTGNMFAYPIGARNGGSTATFILAALGVWTLWVRRRPVALLLLAPFAMNFIAACMERYPYGESARVLQHLAPSVCLFAGTGLMATARQLGGPKGLRRTLHGTGGLMALIIIAGLVSDLRAPYKEIDDLRCREAIAWLAEQSDPDDAWIVSGGFDEPAGESATGPDMNDWGGRIARVRYHLLHQQVRRQSGDLIWSPPLATLSNADFGIELDTDIDTVTIWFIVCHPASDAPSEDLPQLDAYVAAVHAALGEPDAVQRFDIDPAHGEWVELQRFSRPK